MGNHIDKVDTVTCVNKKSNSSHQFSQPSATMCVTKSISCISTFWGFWSQPSVSQPNFDNGGVSRGRSVALAVNIGDWCQCLKVPI